MRAVSRWLVYHLAELDLAVGVLPFAAFLLLLFVSLRRRPPAPEVRVFAAVALSASAWLLVEVAAFAASPFGQQIQERNVFYLEPLFLIALSAWAFGRVPGSLRSTAVSALVAATIVGAVTYTSFIDSRAVSNAFGLLPLGRLIVRGTVDPGQLELVIVLAAMLAGLLFLLLPPRLALVAPAVVLVYLAWANSPVEGTTSQASRDSRVGGVQAPRNWIDHAVGTRPDVAAIWTGAPGLNFVALWDNEFFNRSVGPVYNIHGPPDGLPQETIVLDPASASLRHADGTPLRAKYVLVDRSMTIAGRVPCNRPRNRDDALSSGQPSPARGSDLRDLPGRLLGADGAVHPLPVCGRHARREPRRLPTAPSTPGRSRGQRRDRSSSRPDRGPSGREAPLTRSALAEHRRCLVNFSISPTAVPAKVLGNKDTRQLGIRFRRLVFRPRG